MEEPRQCPLCGYGAAAPIVLADAADHRGYSCPRCWQFIVSMNALRTYLDNPTRRDEFHPKRISILLREWHRKGTPGSRPILLFPGDEESVMPGHPRISVPDLLSTWPDGVPELIDRVLCNLAAESRTPGDPIRIEPFNDNRALFFTHDNSTHERYLIDALVDRRWARIRPEPGGREGTELLVVTPDGWSRVKELTQGKSARDNPVFVAMWFGGDERHTEMTMLYEGGLKPAVVAAGYRVKRADSEGHNDYIMDRVRTDIRRAPFLVADLTNQNPGVYYEAGLAAGQKIPVVHCCPQAERKLVHFDLDQINRVVYDDVGDLRKKLTARILESIGNGPIQAAAGWPV